MSRERREENEIKERQQHEKGSSETDPFVSLDAFTCLFSRLSKKPKERREKHNMAKEWEALRDTQTTDRKERTTSAHDADLTCWNNSMRRCFHSDGEWEGERGDGLFLSFLFLSYFFSPGEMCVNVYLSAFLPDRRERDWPSDGQTGRKEAQERDESCVVQAGERGSITLNACVYFLSEGRERQIDFRWERRKKQRILV